MNFKALWIKFEKFTTVITFKKFERHNYGHRHRHRHRRRHRRCHRHIHIHIHVHRNYHHILLTISILLFLIYLPSSDFLFSFSFSFHVQSHSTHYLSSLLHLFISSSSTSSPPPFHTLLDFLFHPSLPFHPSPLSRSPSDPPVLLVSLLIRAGKDFL